MRVLYAGFMCGFYVRFLHKRYFITHKVGNFMFFTQLRHKTREVE